jgi:hypothetical protein
MREKLEQFSDDAGEALAKSDRGAAPLAQRHIDRFKEIKARYENREKQKRPAHAA